MDQFHIYKDIQARTNGEIYIGVVGPVRTGKSTFIRRFMEQIGLEQLPEKEQKEITDQLPISGSGKIITTVEPKFVPKHGVELKLDDEIPAIIKLIDCVGFLIPGAEGNLENGNERMIKTPWFEKEIPFAEGATIGTQKVIHDHATFGLMITSDGSFGEFQRDQFVDAELKTIQELKKAGKPFMILVNSKKPYGNEAKNLASALSDKFQVQALPVNCEQLKRDDILRILEHMLYEFPVAEMDFSIPKWLELLPTDNEIKMHMIEYAMEMMKTMPTIRHIKPQNVQKCDDYIETVYLDQVDLSTGKICLRIQVNDIFYYEMLSDLTGVKIKNEYDLIQMIQQLSDMRQEYEKVKTAMESVRGKGYGVVMPERDEIKMDDPEIIRQGNKFGILMRAVSPSIHMIRANIETEIAPIVGSESQAQDLIQYIDETKNSEKGIWETNIFGKSIEQLVEEGIQNKIRTIGDESQQKLQDSMEKIVNDSKGGMVCIII